MKELFSFRNIYIYANLDRATFTLLNSHSAAAPRADDDDDGGRIESNVDVQHKNSKVILEEKKRLLEEANN